MKKANQPIIQLQNLSIEIVHSKFLSGGTPCLVQNICSAHVSVSKSLF